MTANDVRQQIETVFRRAPLVPAVLFTNGGRVVVDMPEQFEAWPNEVLLRRSTDPAPSRIRYAEIDRVAALDELPAENGGLSYTEFYKTVRPLLWRDPYEPFALEFHDGTRLVIDRPGRLSLAGRFGVFMPKGPTPLVRFTFDQVVRIIPVDLSRAA